MSAPMREAAASLLGAAATAAVSAMSPTRNACAHILVVCLDSLVSTRAVSLIFVLMRACILFDRPSRLLRFQFRFYFSMGCLL